ncbi:MAG: DUF481 domain-containing protein [Kiritimatiellae bacterium]|nr:DUF481 domain-containing protein [Kiritimatiellia bacterium]
MKLNSMLLCGAAALLTLSAGAQEKTKFETTASLGATLTDGNSETMSANASLVTTGEKEGLGSYRAGAEGNYGENTVRTTDADGNVTETDETTVENAKVFGNVKKTLTARTFAYVDGSVLYDDMAQIDYRAIVGPGLGLYLLKNAATALSVEAGVAYVWEEVADLEDDYTALRLAERFEHKLSDTAKVWQSAEYLPQIDEFDNYLMLAEVGVEAALNSTLNLRLVLQDKYDSQPGDNLERNDLTFIAGVSVKL